ncbi:hypothetical protein [Nonomuraea sp. NPDC005650]|uniref:hypothetical protein n=1 Tax=Nonomuraea sp. NPDC005650 TaxID=3157045 RepID=UPI0033ACB196
MAPLATVLSRFGAAAQVNGCPALIFRLEGEIDTVIAARIDGDLLTVRGPGKLPRTERGSALRR